MTRETKIGLLVGLAFIIVVAILLSDPVNNANEPQAAIVDTASGVRQSLTTPAPSSPTPDRSSVTAIVTPRPLSIAEPIPTQQEASRQANEVRIFPPSTPIKPIAAAPPAKDDSALALAAPPADGGQTPAPAVVGDQTALQKTAAANGETIVSADGQKPAAETGTPMAGKQNYTAQPGDSVSRMANRLMGANTRANRAAIIAANPSLKQNPNRVIVGEVYAIPSAGGAAAAPASGDADASTPAAPTQTADGSDSNNSSSSATRWYVVKPNDSLWHIATNEVGDASAVAEIVSLNKDVLKGGKMLQPNMRLRLPAKQTASAE